MPVMSLDVLDILVINKSSHQRCSIKKEFHKNFAKKKQENTRARVSFLIKLQAKACNFIKKRLAQVFSCEFFEHFKNTFFIEYLQWLILVIIVK